MMNWKSCSFAWSLSTIFFRKLNSTGLWLTHREQVEAHDWARKFCEGFSQLASMQASQGFRMYRIRPKMHMFLELIKQNSGPNWCLNLIPSMQAVGMTRIFLLSARAVLAWVFPNPCVVFKRFWGNTDSSLVTWTYEHLAARQKKKRCHPSRVPLKVAKASEPGRLCGQEGWELNGKTYCA